MEKFRNLKVWQRAHELVLKIYKVTKSFPADERFGLVSQMRRAAISVAANIAEGSKKKSVKERRHFHSMADTSLEELKYYFILSYELRYINGEIGKDLMSHGREIGRMIVSLDKTLTN